jgi:hypothetical protein
MKICLKTLVMVVSSLVSSLLMLHPIAASAKAISVKSPRAKSPRAKSPRRQPSPSQPSRRITKSARLKAARAKLARTQSIPVATPPESLRAMEPLREVVSSSRSLPRLPKLAASGDVTPDVTPSVALSGANSSANVDQPICFVQAANGVFLDLSQICDKTAGLEMFGGISPSQPPATPKMVNLLN